MGSYVTFELEWKKKIPRGEQKFEVGDELVFVIEGEDVKFVVRSVSSPEVPMGIAEQLTVRLTPP